MSGLARRRVVLTRPAASAHALAESLRVAGAEPILYPTIEILPPTLWDALDDALQALHEWDWVVFTSANGVRFALARSQELRIPEDAWRATRIAAIGTATASALADAGIQADALPAVALGVRIPEVIGSLEGTRVLLLRAETARDALPRQLRAGGAIVHDVESYQTVPRRTVDPDAPARLAGVDAVTFTSPSTVRGLVNALGDARESVLRGVRFATIGPVTSDAARDAGLAVHAEAVVHSAHGLVDALRRMFEAIAVDRSAP